MRKPQIVIKTDGIMNTKVLVDGKELEGVAGIRFSQSYKENAGLPTLQIDIKATNVALDAKMLPALPEPFHNQYLPIGKLLDVVPKEKMAELCRECGIELDLDAL